VAASGEAVRLSGYLEMVERKFGRATVEHIREVD